MLKILCLLFFAICIDAISLKSDTFVFSHYVPQYLEANQTFPRAVKYIQNYLPSNVSSSRHVTDKEIAFGGLAAVTGGLAQAYTIEPNFYDPVDLLEYYDDYGRNNYAQVAEITNGLLEDASRKVQPIINLINSLCVREPYIGCNEAVDANVRANPYTYYMPAKLFIHIGKISKNIMKNQVLLEKILNNNEVESYLSTHVNDRGITKLIRRFSKTYVILKRLGTWEGEM